MTLVMGGLLIGWLLGGLGNWAADQLPHAGSAALTPPWRDPRRYWWPVQRPWRTPLLLIATALCTAYTGYRLAPLGDSTWQPSQTVPLLLAWLYVAFFLTVLVIDLEQRRVLNRMLLPAALLALIAGLLPLPGTPTLLSALLGGAIGFGLFLLIFIVGRGRMGAGDVKLAGVIGLIVGYPAVWTALAVGVILGGVAALALIVTRSGDLRSTMAYAPYLALGAIFALWQTWGHAGGL